MEELKALFGDQAISYEEFEKKLADSGDTIRLANLKTGMYVNKGKLDKQIKRFEKYKAKNESKEEAEQDMDAQYASLKAEYDSMSKKYATLLKKQDMAEKMDLISKANVDKKFAEFVYSKVDPQVSRSKDFQTALGEFLKDNSQYLSASKGTFVDLQNGNSGTKSPNQRMNDFIRRKGK